MTRLTPSLLLWAATALPQTTALAIPTPHFLLSQRAATPPTALPQNATTLDLLYQPALDFDTDGCYNVPAISGSGVIVSGLPHHFTGLSSNCRDASDLDNNNVYSRQRCNSGWCIYLYGYYFEKDVAIPNFIDTGHTHDWEHIAVWVRQSSGKAEYVAASQHGNYEVRKAADVRWEEGGTHPKMVYHKDGGSTHCFRFADPGDDAVENHRGVWFKGALVSYNGFPTTEVRDQLFAYDFGKATIDFKDATFAGAIGRAKPGEVTFNTGLDEGSPGTP